jgi:hypothetical protein
MWAFTTFDLPHEKDPFEFLPERAVSGFKIYFPYAGKYYGYLSEFSHKYIAKVFHVKHFVTTISVLRKIQQPPEISLHLRPLRGHDGIAG